MTCLVVYHKYDMWPAPGPRLSHVINSWGRSGILRASRILDSLSSCDWERHVLTSDLKLLEEFRDCCDRYGGWICIEVRSGSRRYNTGSLSDFHQIFFGKWSGNTGHSITDTDASWRPSHLPGPLCPFFSLMFASAPSLHLYTFQYLFHSLSRGDANFSD